MTDPWTAAWAEAAASCPTSHLVYETVELQHPAFLEMGSPIALRFVLDNEERVLGIEAGAAFNPGTLQSFTPINFSASLPEFAQGKVPECKIAIDNAGRRLQAYLNAAVRVRADLTLVARQYSGDDVSEPSYGPVSYVVRNVRIKGARVEGTAKLADLANAKFPTRAYTTAEFPALRA